jgi:hypothetical protein
MRALVWPLFAWWSRDHTATVVAGTTGEVAALASVCLVGMGSASKCSGGTKGEAAALASVRWVGVGSDSHYGGGNDGRGRFSGLC